MKFNVHHALFCKIVIISSMLVCMLISTVSKAGVYQCVNEKGAIEFRDSPCKTSLETQDFLPIQYSKTTAKNVKSQQKTLEKNIKQQNVAEARKQRVATRTEKQRIKAEEKEKRRQEHCVRIKEKIKLLEDKLRAGHKLKTFNRLKAELEHCERMKQRYCHCSS